MDQTSTYFAKIPDWGTFVALPLIGAFLKHLWDRYRGRLSTLRWTVTYQAMAFATEDEGWGKVELLYNGTPAQNIHMAYVQVQNASSRDLAMVNVNLMADSGSNVLRSAGAVRGSTNAFPFATEYSRAIQLAEGGQLPDQDRNFWTLRSAFVIPVLNRGTVADFKLLIARFDYATPTVALSVEHQGVRILHQPFVVEVMGVRQGQATLAGLAVGLAASFGALRYGMATPWLVAFAWLVGATAQVVGAFAVRAWRALIAIAD